jgi:outer membrane PBP1 activator LpoA protein
LQNFPQVRFSSRLRCFCVSAAAAEDTIKIGVVVPLSGSNVQFGQNIRNGINMATKTINEHGSISALGGRKSSRSISTRWVLPRPVSGSSG